LIGNNVGFVIR